jgi:hypothetical protein
MRGVALIALLLVVLITLSCATAGREIDAEQVRQHIVLDKSTKADVLNVCGEPLSAEYDSLAKTEVLHYAYIKKNVTPLGIVTNRIGIGTEWKSDKTVVDFFLKEGIVRDMKIETGSNTTFNYK